MSSIVIGVERIKSFFFKSEMGVQSELLYNSGSVGNRRIM